MGTHTSRDGNFYYFNVDMPLFRLRIFYKHLRGRSGGAMVLGKRPVPGRPTFLE